MNKTKSKTTPFEKGQKVTINTGLPGRPPIVAYFWRETPLGLLEFKQFPAGKGMTYYAPSESVLEV